jgi:radical SAM-linked protein
VIRYAKRDRMRFASHRDVARAFERGTRKARLPVAYSAGFSPHPRISYAGGAPTGYASEAEYAEIALTQTRAAQDVADQLNAALPDGIDVIEVAEAPAEGHALEFGASEWEVVLPGVAPEQAAQAAAAFLAADSAVVERLTSKGTRRVDARAAVAKLAAPRSANRADGTAAIFRMTVRHTTPGVRPDDVLTAIRQVASLELPSPPLVTRLAQRQVAPDGGQVTEQPSATRSGPGSAVQAAARPAERVRPAPVRHAPPGDETPGGRARERDGRLLECSRPSEKKDTTRTRNRGSQADPAN